MLLGPWGVSIGVVQSLQCSDSSGFFFPLFSGGVSNNGEFVIEKQASSTWALAS